MFRNCYIVFGQHVGKQSKAKVHAGRKQSPNHYSERQQRNRMPNMLSMLISRGIVKTTLAKALKLVKPANEIVALAKREKREKYQPLIEEKLMQPFLIEKIYADFPYRFAHRNGYYVRVTKLLTRNFMDNAEMAIIEFEEPHRSFDRLYPPLVAFNMTLDEHALINRTQRGRWADTEHDSFMNRPMRYQRHPEWIPLDDEVGPKEAKNRLKRNRYRGRFWTGDEYRQLNNDDDDPDSTEGIKNDDEREAIEGYVFDDLEQRTTTKETSKQIYVPSYRLKLKEKSVKKPTTTSVRSVPLINSGKKDNITRAVN